MFDSIDNAAAFPAAPRRQGAKMRASDADRHATVEVLQDAVGRGLLNPAEGSERMSAAYAAVHLQDLEPITADLPRTGDSGKPAGWRALLLLLLEQLRTSVPQALSGRRRKVQIGAALLVVLLLLAFGLAAAHLVFDHGGHYGPGGHVPGGYGSGGHGPGGEGQH